MKKFRVQVDCEVTFTVISPFEVDVEAESRDEARRLTETALQGFMTDEDPQTLLKISRKPWEAQIVLGGGIGQRAAFEFNDYQDLYVAGIEEIRE